MIRDSDKQKYETYNLRMQYKQFLLVNNGETHIWIVIHSFSLF